MDRTTDIAAVCRKISYGMYIVCSRNGEKFAGQVVNAAMQVSNAPPTVAISINKNNQTHEFISRSGVFSLSILSVKAPMKFLGLFGFRSGRDIDKFSGIKYRVGITGAPVVLENSLAYLEARLEGSYDAGTHTIFVGKIVAGECIEEGEPMTYSYYQDVKKGKVSRNAPHFEEENKEEKNKKEEKMEKYRCTVCGYVYDPAAGDPDGGIPPGTPFEKLPESWVCPVCGVGKDQFEKE